MRFKYKLSIIASLLLVLAVSCDLSTRGGEQVDPGAVDTVVARTVAAQDAAATQAAQTQAAQMPTPSETPEPSATVEDVQEETTEEPTATFTPTPTEEIDPEIGVRDLNLGRPDQLYEFGVAELMYGYNNNNDRAEFVDGKFVFSIDEPIGFNIWTFSWIEAKNYYVEVSIQLPDECNGLDRAGFIFRTPLTSYDLGYVFLISCDGQYQLIRRDTNTSYTELIKWRSNNAINTGGAINRVGILAKDNTLRFFVNANELESINDSTYNDTGKIGLVIGDRNTPNFQVKFDDFAYWDLP